MAEASAPSNPLQPSGAAPPKLEVVPIAIAGLLLAVGALALAATTSAKNAVLFLLGAGLGYALLHGGFGFTAGWRNIVTRGDGRNLKMQLIVIGLTMTAFIPIMAGVLPGDQRYGGLIAPMGGALFIGAFAFGIGMQLANACGSGTLFTLGGGSKRTMFTLPAFIFGSLLASMHWSYWALPGFQAVNLGKEFGVVGGVLIGLSGLALVWMLISWRERQMARREARSVPNSQLELDGWQRRLWHGPWPLLWAGLALVVLNIATLLVGHFPWAVTYGFALWGANIAALLGVDVSAYSYWDWAKSPAILQRALVTNQQSIMNGGMLLGAMLAAGLGGKFFSAPWPTWRAILAALIGGLLMGYGARLSFGCNIGAFLGGIASGSLHGWVWFAMAFMGSLVGIRLRPYFDLPN